MNTLYVCVARCTAIAIVCVIMSPNDARAQEVLPGFDLFETNTEEGLTSFNGLPFEGVPLGSFDFGGTVGVQNVLNTDTIVRRLQPANPTAGTIDIELVALSLRSVDPVDLGLFNQQGQNFLYVTLSDDPSRRLWLSCCWALPLASAHRGNGDQEPTSCREGFERRAGATM